MDSKIYDTIIIGSGPAGYTAAIYLSRGGLEPFLITGDQIGGQLTLTTDIENYPGFEAIPGPELMAKMKSQAEKFGTKIEIDRVEAIEKADDHFQIKTRNNKIILGKTVLVAVGASAIWLNIPGVDTFRGKGVSACATCDGPFFKDRVVAVIGGGDTAFTEAEFLSRFAKKVYLIHRRENFRAENFLQDRTLANEKIIPLFNTQVKEFVGNNNLENLKMETKFTVESEDKKEIVKTYPESFGKKGKEIKGGFIWSLSVDGAFIAIGYKPNTDFLKGTIDLDGQGYIKTKNEVFTSIPGIFAAGDCVDHRYRQAITAAGQGAKADFEIEEWLKKA